jgi:hypothetical protein
VVPRQPQPPTPTALPDKKPDPIALRKAEKEKEKQEKKKEKSKSQLVISSPLTKKEEMTAEEKVSWTDVLRQGGSQPAMSRVRSRSLEDLVSPKPRGGSGSDIADEEKLFMQIQVRIASFLKLAILFSFVSSRSFAIFSSSKQSRVSFCSRSLRAERSTAL